MSQEALARAVEVERTTVTRWEAGTTAPLPWIRPHLATALAVTLDELALLIEAVPAVEASGLIVLDTPSAVAGHNTSGFGSAPLALDAMREVLLSGPDGIGRKQFLRLLLAAGIAPAGAALALDDAAAAYRPVRAVLDPRSVQSYQSITATQRGLYWTVDAALMLDTGLSHLRLGTRLLSQSSHSARATVDLSGAVAETALLCARVALFDLGQPALAEECFIAAEAAVAQAVDDDLTATVAAHHAFVPGFAGDATTALLHLEIAQQRAGYSTSAWLQSWVHCVSAEITARTGHRAESHASIDRAQEALVGNDVRPPWFDFYDPARLAGFAGNAELLAGNHDSAERWLTTALAELDEKSTKQKSVLLLDLSAASVPNDAERAAAYAIESMTVLESSYYRASFDRLAEVEHLLAPTPFGTIVTERANTLRETTAR